MKFHFSQSSRKNFPSANGMSENSIFEDIAKTRFALETAYLGFDNATDPDLIDCYIYEVNSVMKRYKYLLEQAARLQLLQPENTKQQPAEETKRAACPPPFENTVSYPESPIHSLIGEV